MKRRLVGTVMALTMAATSLLGSVSVMAAKEEDTIKVGYMCEQTTALGFSNAWTDVATAMWKDEINEAGGIDGKQIEFIYYDAQNDPTLATQRLSEMKADGCVAALEIACAGRMAPAIAEWCAENEFPVIHTCNTATAFTIETSSPYMFSCTVNAWGMAKILAENAIGKEGNVTFAYVGVDEACCLDAEFFLEREGKKYNEDCEEVASYRVSWDDSQFSTIISTLLASDPQPDMILQQGGGSNFINIVQQANMYDAFSVMDIYNDLAVDTVSCSDLAQAGEYPYGHIKGFSSFPWWDESTQEFRERFSAACEKYNAGDLVPGDLTYYAYSCAYVLGEALKACVEEGADYTDGNVLTKYIHDVEWSDMCGDHYFRDFDNQMVLDAYYVVSEDGGDEFNHLAIASLDDMGLTCPLRDPQFDFGSELVWNYLERAEKYGMTVALDIYGVMSCGYQIEAFENAIKNFKRLKFVFCHLGMPPFSCGWTEEAVKRWRRILRLAKESNVWFDVAALPEIIGGEEYPYPTAARLVREFIDEYGADKTIWGSDIPQTLTDSTYRQMIHIYEKSPLLTEREKQKLFYENAMDAYFSDL